MERISARPLTALLVGLATTATLAACNGTDSATDDPGTTTVTTVADTAPATAEPDMSIPGGAFNGIVAEIPEVDPAPFASDLIFPAQPGLQFVGPDGTFCEMYGTAEGQISAVQAMCTHTGPGDINAVVLREGEPAAEQNVNRIFMAHENTQTLQPGQRISDGPVSCAVAEGETRVMCALSPYSFAVSTQGLDLG